MATASHAQAAARVRTVNIVSPFAPLFSVSWKRYHRLCPTIAPGEIMVKQIVQCWILAQFYVPSGKDFLKDRFARPQVIGAALLSSRKGARWICACASV
jgi:hypothetical protein